MVKKITENNNIFNKQNRKKVSEKLNNYRVIETIMSNILCFKMYIIHYFRDLQEDTSVNK